MIRANIIAPSVIVLWTALVGCSQAQEQRDMEPQSQEQTIRSLLFGSGQACESDAMCDGAVCDEGSCIGVLLASEPWLQKRVAESVAERLRRDEKLKNEALRLLSAGLTQPHANVSQKARTIPLLEELKVYPLLELLAGSEPSALATQGSLALCRLGHSSQTEFCQALTESGDMAIAVQALHAMARSGYEDTLPVILAMLNPELDRMLIRAGLQALEHVRDPRSVLPLVRFLDDAPDYLRMPVTRTLRAVTGVNLGQSATAWKAWVTANAVPKPPAYTLRPTNSAAVLGIPEP